MRMSFKEFLIESPIGDFKTIGDFSRGSSFTDKRDRMLLTHPRSIEMIKKKFNNATQDFNFYFVNSKLARNHTEVGLVKFEWLEPNLGKEVSDAVGEHMDDDSINVVYTNNKGAERMPMTAWIIAHRLFHALARKNGSREKHNYYFEASDHLISQASILMDCYGVTDFPQRDNEMLSGWKNSAQNTRHNQLVMMALFHKVGTFKSARDANIRDWFEVMNELGAQYLTTGKIKFNKAPESFKTGRIQNSRHYRLQDAETANEILDTLGRDMENLIDNVLSSVMNSVLVM